VHHVDRLTYLQTHVPSFILVHARPHDLIRTSVFLIFIFVLVCMYSCVSETGCACACAFAFFRVCAGAHMRIYIYICTHMIPDKFFMYVHAYTYT